MSGASLMLLICVFNQYSTCFISFSCLKDSLVDVIIGQVTLIGNAQRWKCLDFWFLLFFLDFVIFTSTWWDTGIDTHFIYTYIHSLEVIFLHLCFDCHLSHEDRHGIFHLWHNIGTQEVFFFFLCQSIPAPGVLNQEHSIQNPHSHPTFFWLIRAGAQVSVGMATKAVSEKTVMPRVVAPYGLSVPGINMIKWVLIRETFQ